MAKVIKYKSGLTLVYARHKNSKESVNFEFRFLAGADNDPKGKVGLAHYAEHCLGFTNSKFTKAQKFNLIYNKGCCNLGTTSSSILAGGCVADEQFEECFSAISNWLTDITLPEDEVENERSVIIQEIKQKRMNISWTISQLFNKTIYKNYPHSQLPPFTAAGIVEDVQKITLQDLKDYIAAVFCQQNCQLTICGNVSLGKVKKLIAKYVLPYMPQGTKPPFKKFGEYSVYSKTPKFVKEASPDGDISEVYVTAIYELPQDEKLYTRAARILNSDFSNIALNIFRNKYSLLYTPNAQLGV